MLVCRHENVPFVNALRSSPGAAVSFLLGCLILPGMIFLLAYHIRVSFMSHAEYQADNQLMIFNLTTVEQVRLNYRSIDRADNQIRESASKNLIKATKRPANNPFSAESLWRNVILASVGRPQFPSWINASGWKEVDERRPNPGLMAQAGLGRNGSMGQRRGYSGW